MNGGTIAEIKVELAQLKQAGFRLAAMYLERELKRRAKSAFNAGRKPVYDDTRHVRQREAVKRYRVSKQVQDAHCEIDYNV